MANELAVINANWVNLASQAEQLPVPFQKSIFLLQCHVAGTMRVDDVLAKSQDVDTGTALVLKREPTNEYDSLAIRIETGSGEKLGYAPRDNNPILARLMDAGKLLTATVIKKELKGHWLNICIDINLKDN